MSPDFTTRAYLIALFFSIVLFSVGTGDKFDKRLGVSRLTVSELLREKRSVSPDMALRLARLLNTSPESWLNMQQAVDLWQLGRARTRYARIKPVKAVA